MLLLGSHTSFSKSQLLGCVEETINYGANALMFYTGAPTNTIRSKIQDEYTTKAHELMNEHGINPNHVICHAPYIINLANINNHEFGINFLKNELIRCETLGVNKIVLHPGSAVNCTKEEGMNNIIYALNQVLKNNPNITILLETMAGKGNELGRTTEELQTILNGILYQDKIAICIDTCHLNDAGYDMNNFEKYLAEFDELIGINKIECVHLNDSKNILNAHKDRHENIGFGTIGFNTLLNIIKNPKLKDVPKILETPYIEGFSPYKYEISMIKNEIFNPNLQTKLSSKN